MDTVQLFDNDLIDGLNYFTEMEIDGEKTPLVNEYEFPTTDDYHLRFKVNQKNNWIPSKMSDFDGNPFKAHEVIPESAFEQCNALKSIIIPEGIRAIGPYAFDECENLSSVTLPDSLEYILDHAFSSLNGGNEVELHASFKNLKYLDSDAMLGSLPPSLTNIDYTMDQYGIVYFGHVLFDGTHLYTGDSSPVIKAGTTQIFTGAFNENYDITAITIPSSVKIINSYAFYNTNLERINYNGTAEQFSNITLGTDLASGSVQIFDKYGNEILQPTPPEDATQK